MPRKRIETIEAPELKSIHEAINWIMSQVGYVQKKRAQGLNYSFAGEAALIQALRPYMVASSVVMYVSNIKSKVLTPYETAKGTAMMNVTLDCEVVFTHAPSGTSIVVMASGEGSDSGDKASNKALTGAYKYALRHTFCIETGDDPDETPSRELERKVARQSEKQLDPVAAAKARLVEDLKEYYPDTQSLAAAMKREPAIKFDPTEYGAIKAELIRRADG